MKIYLIRHGETSWNTLGRLQGRTDIELNENGIRLAKITGEKLKDVHFDLAIASPLKRAYETAGLVLGSDVFSDGEMKNRRDQFRRVGRTLLSKGELSDSVKRF